MATINEADVIRIIQQNPRLVFNAMREDPELLKEVRQAILTDDILGLPKQLARISHTLETLVGVASTLNDRVGGLEASAERTDARLDRLEASTERTDARLDRIERSAERTDAKVDRIDARLDRIESLVGYLVGSELERKLESVVPNRLEAVYELDDIHILVYQDRHPRGGPQFSPDDRPGAQRRSHRRRAASPAERHRHDNQSRPRRRPGLLHCRSV